jgi:hypothetical protein
MKLTQTEQLILNELAGGAQLGRNQKSSTGYLLIRPLPRGTSRKCQQKVVDNLMLMGLIQDPPSNGLTDKGRQLAKSDRA